MTTATVPLFEVEDRAAVSDLLWALYLEVNTSDRIPAGVRLARSETVSDRYNAFVTYADIEISVGWINRPNEWTKRGWNAMVTREAPQAAADLGSEGRRIDALATMLSYASKTV